MGNRATLFLLHFPQYLCCGAHPVTWIGDFKALTSRLFLSAGTLLQPFKICASH